MSEPLHPLEMLWDRLLSRDTEQVRSAFAELTPEEQKAVRNHLRRMAKEPDWSLEQRQSAEVAIEALKRYF